MASALCFSFCWHPSSSPPPSALCETRSSRGLLRPRPSFTHPYAGPPKADQNATKTRDTSVRFHSERFEFRDSGLKELVKSFGTSRRSRSRVWCPNLSSAPHPLLCGLCSRTSRTHQLYPYRLAVVHYSPLLLDMAPLRPIKRPRAATQDYIRLPIPAAFLSAKVTNRRFTMPLFTRSKPLTSRPSRRDEIDAFLSSDAELALEDSFASNMSLNSPPQSHVHLPSTDDSRNYVPMDISPAPQRVLPPSKSQPYRHDEDMTARLPPVAKVAAGRPRSNTSSGTQRLFGKDVSNNRNSSSSDGYVVVSNKGSEKGKATEKSGKRLQRAALPFQWMNNAPAEDIPQDQSIMSSATKLMDISSSPVDAMDIDMSFASISSSAPEPPSPLSAAPTITQFNVKQHYVGSTESSVSRERSLSNLFYESVSPRRRSIGGTRPQVSHSDEVDLDVCDSPQQPVYKKKRSFSPQSSLRRGHHHLLNEDALSSSPALMSSPSVHKLERLNSKPIVRAMAAGEQMGLNANNKRPRRPVLSAMVIPGDMEGPLHSALPVLETAAGNNDREREKVKEVDARPRHGERALPPVRRAFSAMIPTSINPMEQSFESEGENSLSIDGPDMSSPAVAYAKRQHVKTIRRCDGTDDFRSMTGATALLKRDGEMRGARKSEEKVEKPVETERDTPRSKYLTGLSGFGDNEAHGKVLPCHRVREDGLMRISVDTMNDLLDGKFDSQITDFQVIDCRFEYEYDGGHIPGAVNVNTIVGVEELLLGKSVKKPEPSTSGDGTKKTVLVFHCEFSCKRAPTFAKHLRSKDRSVNARMYPRIHYPEVYILEGGYCGYWKASGDRCQPPQAYVRMDDPVHAVARKEDLDQFRSKAKFGRTKSYAYGESKNTLVAPPMVKRNSAPSNSVAALFVTGNAARSRRSNGLLQTLQEDSSGALHSEDEDTDVGDSPCPPPTKGVPFKGKKIGRAPLIRAETYNPARTMLGF
ncbi:hypothetical protein BC835DRAFT_110253 [Cytidiella melzeri]|nr:hypothetical protein BC835DRAFT_110253 [Cytidiella melzeri]